MCSSDLLGTMTLAALQVLLPDDLQRSNALKSMLSLVINAVAVLVFVFSGFVAWLPSLIMAVAALLLAILGGAGIYAWYKRPAAPAVVSETVPVAVPVVQNASTESAEQPIVNVTTTTDANGARRLELNLSAKETTWLSITSDGKQIFSGILHADETKTLSGLEVARLKVGNAGGLDVQWNGKQVGPLGESGQVKVVVFTPEGFSILPGNTEASSGETL